MKRHAILLVLLLPTFALALAACGGSSNDSASASPPATSSTEAAPTVTPSGSGNTTLELAADPNGGLMFDKTTLTAPAGKVTIDFTNQSSTAHDVSIQGDGVDVTSDIVDNGGTTSVSANLTPGTYTFLCTVDGHADAGMKGTLTVTG